MCSVFSFIAFVRGSPKRLAWFKLYKSDGTNLRPFCPTRWILRKTSVSSITSNYAALLEWLEDYQKHPENRKHACEAAGYLQTFRLFDTYFKLELLRIIFTIVEDTNTALQGKNQLNFKFLY